ncbi:MAG: LysM peptidoglycan-binding domain-containing M23 family metallopeptidase [Alphaproteobacteria bacterium]|nr:LysM peptidoglycan-binding domain-containing M23 family metallopeptidase [Alphaproteobacteria bacterium]
MKARHYKILLLTTALTAWMGAAPVSFAQPAPVRNYGASAPPANGAVTVQKGDTLAAIARRYKVSLNALAGMNGMSPNEMVGPGRRLVLPVARTHKVLPNDTMFSLSRMYGTTVDKMAEENGIKPPYALKSGQVLKIPSGANSAAVAKPDQAKPVQVKQAASAPPQPEPAMTASASSKPTPMLKTPGPSPVTKAFDSLIGKLAADNAEAETVPKVSLVSAATAEPATRGAEMVGRSSRQGFIWPVKGQVISSYGPKTGGLYNDGINIAAPRGTPVKAASSGTVAYVGEMRSYGNLVLIRHTNGMVTTYAHLNTVSVKPGMKVSQGQVIGAVGSTGTVMNAQLHFEVRRGKNTLDPKQYLG